MNTPQPTPASLVQIVDAALASAVLRSGPHLACRPGCSQCCHGVFEITALDAQRLREGLLLLSTQDPARAAQIQDRVAQARAHLAPFFPGEPATGSLGSDEQQIALFEEWAHADPCPILDPIAHTCDLYAHRPILCRTFGPPIRNHYADPEAGLAICDLCFNNATDSEIAAAEIDSSFRPFEEFLESDHRRQNPASCPTYIPFAF